MEVCWESEDKSSTLQKVSSFLRRSSPLCPDVGEHLEDKNTVFKVFFQVLHRSFILRNVKLVGDLKSWSFS